MQVAVVDFLKEQGITYYTEGTKNTGTGWVSIRCPFCDDQSNHLGIKINGGGYNCFRCGRTGSFEKLIAKLRQIPLEIAKALSYQYKSTTQLEEKHLTKLKQEEIKPEDGWQPITDGREHPALRSFMEKRRFSIENLVREGCWVAQTGKYKHRLIIPIRSRGKLVAFQARDITGTAIVPYLSYGNLYDYVYWLDDWVGGYIVVTEGVFDSWRIGKGRSVALFSTSYSQPQVQQLREVNPQRVHIAFDQDARKEAVKLKVELEPYVPVRILNIIGDPADMKTSLLKQLIKGGKNDGDFQSAGERVTSVQLSNWDGKG